MYEITNDKIKQVTQACGCGAGLARELLMLAGGDVDMVIDASEDERSGSSAKAAVVNMRLDGIEENLFDLLNRIKAIEFQL